MFRLPHPGVCYKERFLQFAFQITAPQWNNYQNSKFILHYVFFWHHFESLFLFVLITKKNATSLVSLVFFCDRNTQIHSIYGASTTCCSAETHTGLTGRHWPQNKQQDVKEKKSCFLSACWSRTVVVTAENVHLQRRHTEARSGGPMVTEKPPPRDCHPLIHRMQWKATWSPDKELEITVQKCIKKKEKHFWMWIKKYCWFHSHPNNGVDGIYDGDHEISEIKGGEMPFVLWGKRPGCGKMPRLSRCRVPEIFHPSYCLVCTCLFIAAVSSLIPSLVKYVRVCVLRHRLEARRAPRFLSQRSLSRLDSRVEP